MKTIELHGAYGLENLRTVERPEPVPGPGEIAVRIRAASLNYRDLVIVKGTYGAFPLPLVPVSDGAGEVIAVGPQVTRFQIGDRVVPTYIPDWISGPPRPELIARRLGGPVDGVLTEIKVVSEQSAVRVPDHLSFAEASTLPIAGVTAWEALFGGEPLRPGETVVIQGTGGVGVMALQLAAASGARAIVVSGSAQKGERARALGADEVIPREGWSERVLELTHGAGADRVLELAGGDLEATLRATKLGGAIVMIGFLADRITRFDVTKAISRMVTLRAVSVGSRGAFEALNEALLRSDIHPVIDATYGFDEVQRAFQHLAEGGHMGKLVLEPWGTQAGNSRSTTGAPAIASRPIHTGAPR